MLRLIDLSSRREMEKKGVKKAEKAANVVLKGQRERQRGSCQKPVNQVLPSLKRRGPGLSAGRLHDAFFLRWKCRNSPSRRALRTIIPIQESFL